MSVEQNLNIKNNGSHGRFAFFRNATILGKLRFLDLRLLLGNMGRLLCHEVWRDQILRCHWPGDVTLICIILNHDHTVNLVFQTPQEFWYHMKRSIIESSTFYMFAAMISIILDHIYNIFWQSNFEAIVAILVHQDSVLWLVGSRYPAVHMILIYKIAILVLQIFASRMFYPLLYTD